MRQGARTAADRGSGISQGAQDALRAPGAGATHGQGPVKLMRAVFSPLSVLITPSSAQVEARSSAQERLQSEASAAAKECGELRAQLAEARRAAEAAIAAQHEVISLSVKHWHEGRYQVGRHQTRAACTEPVPDRRARPVAPRSLGLLRMLCIFCYNPDSLFTWLRLH